MLKGIAKLASESPRLGAKRAVEYFELAARSLINRVPDMRFFQWAINPYRGCEFGCHYCYARYTHEFMELRDSHEFEEKIYAKASVGPLLRRDLRKVPRGDIIAIGTATDPYQPAERRFHRTREILKIFAEDGGRHISVTTKSDLVVRDVEILRQIARRNTVQVTLTITAMNTDLARALEPRAPRPDLRIDAVRILTEASIPAGVFTSPVLPLINDSEDSLRSVAQCAKAAGAAYFGAQVLFLSSTARKAFFPFLASRYPHLVGRYMQLYERDMYLRGEYPDRIRALVHRLRAETGLDSAPIAHVPAEASGHEQMVLFPEPTAARPSSRSASAGPFPARGLPRVAGTCA